MQEPNDAAAISGTVTQPETLTFSQALDWMKEGKRVRRNVWREGQYLIVSKFNTKLNGYTQFELHQDEGSTFGWSIAVADLLSNDWTVVN